MKPPLKMTTLESLIAARDWGFNCGPGALCAALNLTPDEIRPHLDEFEKRGYMNPTQILAALKKLGADFRQTYRADEPSVPLIAVKHGLTKIQWGGPWCKKGVPMTARYYHTHWIANHGDYIFDVNAKDGWIHRDTWTDQLVPWLLKQIEPKWDGTFWPTNAYEVTIP